jgi:hypothetical protein
MNRFTRTLALATIASGTMAIAATAEADVSINIGAEPVCPYGYYDTAPYACAPYGYYGPEWFNGGVFLGVGPWFHGPDNFRGHVDNRFDVNRGYRGPLPNRGDQPDAGRHLDHIDNFRGNEMREGHGGRAGGGRR